MDGKLTRVQGVVTDFDSGISVIETECPVNMEMLDDIAFISTHPIDPTGKTPQTEWMLRYINDLEQHEIYLKRSPSGNLSLSMPYKHAPRLWDLGDMVFIAPRIPHPIKAGHRKPLFEILKKAIREGGNVRVTPAPILKSNPGIVEVPNLREQLKDTNWQVQLGKTAKLVLPFDHFVFVMYHLMESRRRLAAMQPDDRTWFVDHLEQVDYDDPSKIYNDDHIRIMIRSLIRSIDE